MPEEVATSIRAVFSRGGLVAPGTWLEVVEILSGMSYGMLSLPDEPETPPSVECELIADVLNIWRQGLSACGLTFEVNLFEPFYENPERMGLLLETGRMIGIDSMIRTRFEGGVPVEDVLS